MCLLRGITSEFDILSYITPWQNHSTPLLCRLPALFWQSRGTWRRTWSLDTWCVLWSPQSQHGLSHSCAGALGWCIDLALSVPRWVCRPFPVQPQSLRRISARRQSAPLHSAFLTNDGLPHSKVIITVLLQTLIGGYQLSPLFFCCISNFDLIESHHTLQPSLCLNNMYVMRVEEACGLGGGKKSIRLNAADANGKLDQTRKNKERRRQRDQMALFQNPVSCLHRKPFNFRNHLQIKHCSKHHKYSASWGLCSGWILQVLINFMQKWKTGLFYPIFDFKYLKYHFIS